MANLIGLHQNRLSACTTGKRMPQDRSAFGLGLPPAGRQSQMIPSEDPDYGDLGPAFPAWTSPGWEPILQPPKPEIPPSSRILERAMDRDTDWEAAD